MGIKILALDQNLQTGFSYSGGNSGCLDLTAAGKNKSAGACALFLFDWLTSRKIEIDLIAFENFVGNNIGPGKGVQATIKAAVEMAAAKLGVPAISYFPASVKLRATGSGKADKAAMTVALRQRVGESGMIDCITHDVVDAIWIRLIAEEDFRDCRSRAEVWEKIGRDLVAKKAVASVKRREKAAKKKAKKAAGSSVKPKRSRKKSVDSSRKLW